MNTLRNLSLADRERLIETGEIWIDEAGEIRPLNLDSYDPEVRYATGQPPDMVKVGEEVRNSRIRKLALAYMEAARAHGCALRAVEAAERVASEALIRYERAALAAWSKKNARIR